MSKPPLGELYSAFMNLDENHDAIYKAVRECAQNGVYPALIFKTVQGALTDSVKHPSSDRETGDYSAALGDLTKQLYEGG